MAAARKTKPAPGRPSRLTPDRAARIAELVAAGNSQETAAQAAGVSTSAFYKWMARGRAEIDRLAAHHATKPRPPETPYVELVEAVEKARAEAEARLVLLIAKAAQEPRTWQAAAWLLERRDPQRWGRPWRQPAEAEGTGAVETAVRAISTGPLLPGEEP